MLWKGEPKGKDNLRGRRDRERERERMDLGSLKLAIDFYVNIHDSIDI